MKVQRFDGSKGNAILAGMIVNRTVLGRVASAWVPPGLFESPSQNVLGGMCVDYYRRYGKAPRSSFSNLVRHWATKKQRSEQQIEQVDRLATQLSEARRNAKPVHSSFLLDQAQAYFDETAKRRHVKAMEAALDAGDMDKADELHNSFRRIEMGSSDGAFLDDKEVWQQAFAETTEPLITYPGPLGHFFGDCFQREGLVAFFGPEKRGKTHWLTDVAWRAMQQRRKVAFFGAGDMSRVQMVRQRFATRAARRPLRPGPYRFPRSLIIGDKGGLVNKWKEREAKKWLDWQTAFDRYLNVLAEEAKSRGKLFWLACYPNSTLTVEKIHSVLDGVDGGGWEPDVIVIDYADILQPPAGRKEPRDQNNEVWKQLRALSQQRHCLVVTASQTSADSYDARMITMKHFSEDKRKLAHATGVIGINVSSHEKDEDVCRLNWVALRDREFNTYRPVYCAGCLKVGNPAMVSLYPQYERKEQ